MKATEQYFPVVLFIMLYKVVLPFEFVDKILKCDYSNESYLAALSCHIDPKMALNVRSDKYLWNTVSIYSSVFDRTRGPTRVNFSLFGNCTSFLSRLFPIF